MSARHIVLAGDSIFDNDVYVPGEPGVLDQLRRALPAGWRATKLAIDGDVVAGVAAQVKQLPQDATDLIVSVGGNNALAYAHLLDSIRAPADIAVVIGAPVAAFTREYAAMLDVLQRLPARLQVCTIYTAIPFDDPAWRTLAPLGIAAFNNAILTEAAKRAIPVLRLDLVCSDENDYSTVSPIEPSAKGGQKIVELIVQSLA